MLVLNASGIAVCNTVHISTSHMVHDFAQGANSSLLDVDRMHEIVNECCDLFQQKFPLSFEFALYDEYKRKNSLEPDDAQLPQPPLHKFPLKDGWLYKRGDVSYIHRHNMINKGQYYE